MLAPVGAYGFGFQSTEFLYLGLQWLASTTKNFAALLQCADPLPKYLGLSTPALRSNVECVYGFATTRPPSLLSDFQNSCCLHLYC